MAKKIQINMSNKVFYTFIALGIFILLGIGVFAYNSQLNSPSVFGHTIDEIEIIDSEGGAPVSLEQYIENRISGVGEIACDSSPIYDSMSLTDSKSETGIKYNDDAYKYNNGVKTIPSACLSDSGCIIRQVIYDSKGIKLTRQYNYIQYETNKWWSSYKTAGTYNNGDSILTDILPSYGGDSALYLKDDYYKSGTGYTQETSPSTVTFIDRSGVYGMKVYICSESTQ
jgi:hypothetical protein